MKTYPVKIAFNRHCELTEAMTDEEVVKLAIQYGDQYLAVLKILRNSLPDFHKPIGIICGTENPKTTEFIFDVCSSIPKEKFKEKVLQALMTFVENSDKFLDMGVSVAFEKE